MLSQVWTFFVLMLVICRFRFLIYSLSVYAFSISLYVLTLMYSVLRCDYLPSYYLMTSLNLLFSFVRLLMSDYKRYMCDYRLVCDSLMFYIYLYRLYDFLLSSSISIFLFSLNYSNCLIYIFLLVSWVSIQNILVWFTLTYVRQFSLILCYNPYFYSTSLLILTSYYCLNMCISYDFCLMIFCISMKYVSFSFCASSLPYFIDLIINYSWFSYIFWL